MHTKDGVPHAAWVRSERDVRTWETGSGEKKIRKTLQGEGKKNLRNKKEKKKKKARIFFCLPSLRYTRAGTGMVACFYFLLMA